MHKTKQSSLLHCLLVALVFSSCSAMAWLVANDFQIAREEGFDPLRYEYFARNELPEYLAGSSSYTIVSLLRFLYIFLPPYFGFVGFISVILGLLLHLDRDRLLRSAILSPITFFYIAQTGKDGLAILAIISVATMALRRIDASIFLLLMIMATALLVRPALALFLPIVFVHFRIGVKFSTLLAIVISTVFLGSSVGVDSLSLLEDVVSDAGSGVVAQIGREMTMGYSLGPILGRATLLFLSPLIQPIGSIVKFINGTDAFVIFEGCCQLAFLLAIFKLRIAVRFFVSSIPFVIVVAAASPFYHFRYIAILYPIIFAYALTPAIIGKLKMTIQRKRSQFSRLLKPANPLNTMQV